jgi:hypothetical protein
MVFESLPLFVLLCGFLEGWLHEGLGQDGEGSFLSLGHVRWWLCHVVHEVRPEGTTRLLVGIVQLVRVRKERSHVVWQ